MSQDIFKDVFVERMQTHYDFGHGVVISMPEEQATLLFHAVNRLMSALDETCPNLVDGRHPDAADQRAYDLTNGFLCELQTKLGIDPEDDGR